MIPLGVFGGCHSINSEVESAAIIVTLFGMSDGATYKILYHVSTFNSLFYLLLK